MVCILYERQTDGVGIGTCANARKSIRGEKSEAFLLLLTLAVPNKREVIFPKFKHKSTVTFTGFSHRNGDGSSSKESGLRKIFCSGGKRS